MKNFIEFLLTQFVNNPSEVEVTETKDGNFSIFTIKVSESDIGVVIGKAGKTINSIRNLVRAKAIKDNVMVRVVLEDNGTRPTPANESL